jgi:hypothetical protein
MSLVFGEGWREESWHTHDGLMMRVRWVKRLQAELVAVLGKYATVMDKADKERIEKTLEETKEWL